MMFSIVLLLLCVFFYVFLRDAIFIIFFIIVVIFVYIFLKKIEILKIRFTKKHFSTTSSMLNSGGNLDFIVTLVYFRTTEPCVANRVLRTVCYQHRFCFYFRGMCVAKHSTQACSHGALGWVWEEKAGRIRNEFTPLKLYKKRWWKIGAGRIRTIFASRFPEIPSWP